MLALILVTLGYGPWQRWLPLLVIVAVGRGVLVYIRGRNRGTQINGRVHLRQREWGRSRGQEVGSA